MRMFLRAAYRGMGHLAAEAVIAAAGSGKKMGSETVELPASVLMRNSVKNELPRSKQRETGKPKQ